MGLIKLGLAAAGAGYIMNKATRFVAFLFQPSQTQLTVPRSAERRAEMKTNPQQPQNYYPEQQQYDNRPALPQRPQHHSQYQNQNGGYAQQRQWEKPAEELSPPQYRDAAGQGYSQQRPCERPSEGDMSWWTVSKPDAKR